MPRRVLSLLVLGVLAALVATEAHAVVLRAPPGAPLWMHLGADALLYAHIAGGAVGLLSGVAAIASRKGGAAHILAGKIFLASMFITYLIGAGVAPFLSEGQRPNFVGGVMALYLLMSGWLTVRGRGGVRAGRQHYVGFGIAVLIAGMGAVFMMMGLNSPTGTIDSSPPQAFILFMIAGSFAAAGELNVILRKTLNGPARLARHLWRMCCSMFIASGSLFLGQPQVFPDWFNASLLAPLLSFAPLIAMAVWLVLVRLRRHRAAA